MTQPKSARECKHILFARSFAAEAGLGGPGSVGDGDLAALRSLPVEHRRELYRRALASTAWQLSSGYRSPPPVFPGVSTEVVQRLWDFCCRKLVDGPDGLEG